MMREAKPIKMVVSDLDGTLLDESRFISDDAVRLIDHLKKQNIGFTFITGRPYTAVKKFETRANITLPIVTCNGAEIIHGGNSIYLQSVIVKTILRCFKLLELAQLYQMQLTLRSKMPILYVVGPERTGSLKLSHIFA